MSAVYELCTIKAIAPDDYHYTPEEWVVYSQGYYFAIARSLKVMELAVHAWGLYCRTRRAENRARKQGRRDTADL